MTTRVIRSLDIKAPKTPKSDATLEQMETFQKEVDSYSDKRQKAIRKGLEKETKQLEKELRKLNRDELVKRYESVMIAESCEQEAIQAYKEATVYYGTFKDENYKERFFEEMEDVRNLPSEIKQQFIDAAQVLEIGGEELKKLRIATP